MVHEILVDASGKAVGVRYTDDTGTRRELRADFVVVAASAVESARLLLMSLSRRFPNGLGNNSGQIGRNLCFSTLTRVRAFLRRENLPPSVADTLFEPAPFLGRALQDFRVLPPEGESFGRGGTLHLLWAHPNPIYAAESLIKEGPRLVWGEELMARLRERFTEGRMIEVEGYSDWLATPGTGVDLDPDVRDKWGWPVARITLDRHPSDRATSTRLAREAKSFLDALGGESEITDVGGETWVLQGGTCRMGHDPSASATTPEGRLHEVPNVYVSDGAALPTTGTVPCTETILANAFRIGEHIVGANR